MSAHLPQLRTESRAAGVQCGHDRKLVVKMAIRGVNFDAHVTLEAAHEEALLKLLKSPTFCRQASGIRRARAPVCAALLFPICLQHFGCVIAVSLEYPPPHPQTDAGGKCTNNPCPNFTLVVNLPTPPAPQSCLASKEGSHN